MVLSWTFRHDANRCAPSNAVACEYVALDLGQNGPRFFDPWMLEFHLNVPLKCSHLKEKHSISLPILSNYFCLRRRGEENINMNREEIGWGGVTWSGLVWVRTGASGAVVNTVMSFGVLYSAGNFLTAVHNNNNNNNNNSNSNNRVKFIFRCSGLPTD